MDQTTNTLFNLHKCLGALEASVRELATRIELLEREAMGAPESARMAAARQRGEHYAFYARSREEMLADADLWRGHIAGMFVTINDIREQLFPTQMEWGKMISIEAKRAISEAQFEQLRSIQNRGGSNIETIHSLGMLA
jgi:hypothetical protein